MKTRFSHILGALALTMSAVAQAATPVPSQITLIVPFGAGASNDTIARILAPELSRLLNTQVIVENKAGAAGTIGAAHVAKSVPDGSTLLLSSSTFVTAAATQPSMPYDALKAFTPVAMVGAGPLVLGVPGDLPYQSLEEFVAAARKEPGKLNYGSSGIGSLAHLATTVLADAADINITHVPYKGAAAAGNDLAGGRIELMIANYSSLVPLLEGNRVRLIAVTSPEQDPAFPKLTPAAKAVPGYEADIWVGIFAPAGLPADLTEAYNKAINQANQSPRLKELLQLDGTVPANVDSATFAQRVAADLERWKAVATKHNITAN